MSSTFESSVKQIPHSQTTVYNTLSDLSNIERIKDKIPTNKVEDFSFDSDSISIKAPMVGDNGEQPRTVQLLDPTAAHR